MRKPRQQHRYPHGAPWYWKQSNYWYCTLPGTKKRIAQFDENGQRIRGKGNQFTADLAFARLKIAGDEGFDAALNGQGEWLVARVASDYIQYCERGIVTGTISKDYRDSSLAYRSLRPSSAAGQ